MTSGGRRFDARPFPPGHFHRCAAEYAAERGVASCPTASGRPSRESGRSAGYCTLTAMRHLSGRSTAACGVPKADIAHGVAKRKPITSAYMFESHPVRQFGIKPGTLVFADFPPSAPPTSSIGCFDPTMPGASSAASTCARAGRRPRLEQVLRWMNRL